MNQKLYLKFINEVLTGEGVHGALITSPANMRYFSGFRGEGAVFISNKLKLVFTDSRYTEAAGEECPDFEVIQVQGGLYESWLKVIMNHTGIAAIGFEDLYMTVRDERRAKELMEASGFAGASFVPLGESLNRLRQIKAAEEIQSIERAERIGDAAFERIVERLRRLRGQGETMTERQVAAWLEFYMKDLGAEGTSFDTIAASGVHSSMPHAIPTDKVLEEGDFLTMDFGCRVDGYCSDMTRTIAWGGVSDRQREVYDTVLRAQEAALAAVKPGIMGREVDAVARDMIRAAGFGECFGHGLGHSVGLMIHETPCFSPKDKNVIRPGMVITVEPGIYLEGEFGVRIEDVVVVTESGCRNITGSPKELIIV